MDANPTSDTHRFAILRDKDSWGPRASFAAQAAANRQALLQQLADLTDAIATDAAGEGIDAAELGRIRSAALRLAAAADAAAALTIQP